MNTVCMFRNDAGRDIENNPQQVIEDICHVLRIGRGETLSAGRYGNAIEAMNSVHSSDTVFYVHFGGTLQELTLDIIERHPEVRKAFERLVLSVRTDP